MTHCDFSDQRAVRRSNDTREERIPGMLLQLAALIVGLVGIIGFSLPLSRPSSPTAQ